jgi:glutamate-5-semialdehyde dehydrogenase
MTLDEMFVSLREAQRRLALQAAEERNAALRGAAAAIDAGRGAILTANGEDVARASGMKVALIERLALDEKKIDGIVDGLETVAALPDPLGKVKAGWTLPNGLVVEQVTVPLGVAAIIYESRPNVTADAFALAYKAGCAILLRGSSAALSSNRAIVAALQRGLEEAGGLPSAVALAPSESRDEVAAILGARGMVDVVIPRGGHALIRAVVENARVPVIETGEGNCHIYVEPGYDVEKACAVIANAKLQRPGACNAVETVLVHRDALSALIPALAHTFAGKAELRLDASCMAALGTVPAGLAVKPATEDDWAAEYLDFILAVKTVDSLDEAIAHINRYGTGHSEAILTERIASADTFRREVDAACVYVNASTRFTDGGEFGFGCELGISTQKFHARGPMGLDALTTTKYLVSGNGQVR